jgi:ammonia channel protein AmtB
MPALRRSAPTVRFISFDTLVTGVRAFEWALSVLTSSLVHGLIARRADFAGFMVFALFVALFATLGIAHVLQLNERHIVP